VKEPVERSGWAARSEEVVVLKDALRICCCCIAEYPAFVTLCAKGRRFDRKGAWEVVLVRRKLDVNFDRRIVWSGLS
jgi:hypothetical protein